MIDLKENNLHEYTTEELTQIFASIRRNGTTISFAGSNLFVNKTDEEHDTIITNLRTAANGRLNLDISDSGKSDIQRAIAPCIELYRFYNPQSKMPY